VVEARVGLVPVVVDEPSGKKIAVTAVDTSVTGR